MRNIPTVIKDFFIYSSGAVAIRGITLMIAPFIVRKIAPAEYGVLSLLNSFISILASIVGLGLRQVLSIEYFHTDAADRKHLVNDIIIIYIVASLPLFALLYYTRTLWSHAIFSMQPPESLLFVALVCAFLFFFSELLMQVLRYEQQSRTLILLQLIIALTTTVCTIFFVFILQTGIIGIIGAQAIGTLIASIIGLIYFFSNHYNRYLHIKQSISNGIYYIAYGIPFLPGILFSWILSAGNKWFIAHYADLHAVGIYAIADMFGQLFHLFILQPWSSAYLPYILRQFVAHKNNVQPIVVQNNRNMYITMTALIILIAISYVITKPILLWILPSNYHESIQYIWIILLGYVFLLGSYFASNLIQFYKKRYFLAFSLAIPAILNIMLNFFFIPKWGIYGSTTATLISYIVYFAITLEYSMRLSKR